MFTVFASDDEGENRGRGRGRDDEDEVVSAIPETSTYAAIGFMSVVVGTVLWNKRRNK